MGNRERRRPFTTAVGTDGTRLRGLARSGAPFPSQPARLSFLNPSMMNIRIST